MKPPTLADWGEIQANNIDAESAFASFYGKSFQEAEDLFRSNAYCHQEELLSMPRVPFNFYVTALVKYILSPDAKGDSDGASSFLHLIIAVFETLGDLPSPETEHMLLMAARTVAAQQSFYEADPTIYGQFPELLARARFLANDA